MRYELATNQQLNNIINHDKDIPTHLLGGLVLEMVKRRMWDKIINYSMNKAYRNAPYVMKHILKIDMEDLIQIAHIELIEIVKTFKQGMRSFGSYAIMCLIGKFHVIHDYAEREKRKADLNTSDIDDLPLRIQNTIFRSSANIENYVINKITIEEAWNVLRDVEKKAIILEQMGYTQEEAAEMVGLNKRSGNVILRRAYAKLRKAMVA
jgi:RNA polymerase sigma factor (sigma-70 family)